MKLCKKFDELSKFEILSRRTSMGRNILFTIKIKAIKKLNHT